MMKKYILSIGAAVLMFSFVGVAYANHSWGGYHWARTTGTFTLKLGDNVGSVWDAYLGTSSSDWSVSSVLDTAVVAGVTNPKNCRPTSGRVEVCNASYGNNGWLGIAQIWASGLHITQGTVKMNDTYFNTATYNKPSWRQFVMCQEVGHTFGLDHQDENFNNLNLGTCMDYTNDPSRNDGVGDNLHPNQHDYDELAAIYGHLDTVNTVRSSASSLRAGAVDITDRTEWGKAVRKDSKGNNSVYRRNLGNGEEVFTFVVWAE